LSILLYAPTETSENESIAKQINFGAILEIEIDNIIDATELQQENTEMVRDSSPRVSAYNFSRFNNAYTRMKSIPDMWQVHECNLSSEPETTDKFELEMRTHKTTPLSYQIMFLWIYYWLTIKGSLLV